MRFQAKEGFRAFLKKRLFKENVASFLGSLITGDVEKRELRYQFGKVGLQHLLAISGFHFALLIYFFSLFLDLFLNPKAKIIALLILIHFYFFFVGSVPSVQRSYLLALFYLSSLLIDRHGAPLNLLGAALLIECLINPWIVSSIGFQLSFVSSAGILLLYRPLESICLNLLSPSKDLNFISEHGRIFSLFLIRSMSLSIAVNLSILPLLLYHFHAFPILSLFYNLFFPLVLSLALFMLLFSFLSFVIFPPISPFFFSLTDFFTAQLLDLIRYPPVSLDYSFRVYEFPALFIPFYLFALLLFSVSYRQKKENTLIFLTPN